MNAKTSSANATHVRSVISVRSSTSSALRCSSSLFFVILLETALFSHERAANALQRDLGDAVMRTYTKQGLREP
jgi:hypothetical protein